MTASSTAAAAIAPAVVAPKHRGPFGWLLHPMFLIFVGALLNTAGEVLLKRGAAQMTAVTGSSSLFGVGALASAWTWAGIVSYVLSFVSWLYVLRFVPLSVAFPVINIVHVLVPIGSRLFLHEPIPIARWAGIGAILLGIALIIRPLVVAEEKL